MMDRSHHRLALVAPSLRGVLRVVNPATSLAKVAAANEVVPGPTTRYVIANVKRLRAEQNLSQADLSRRMSEVGRPILPTGLHRLENGRRRIDVDDLIGLALALGVSPVTLLLPPIAEGEVELTDTTTVDARAAWEWARARRPLDEPADDDGYAAADFLRRSLPRGVRPYPPTRAGMRLLQEDRPDVEVRTRTVADLRGDED